MRGLTIIVVAADRLAPALVLAMAQAALGGRSRVFAQGGAVAGFAQVEIGEALALGVELFACQTGLADIGADLSRLDPRIAASGPLAVLQSLGDDRLVAF